MLLNFLKLILFSVYEGQKLQLSMRFEKVKGKNQFWFDLARALILEGSSYGDLYVFWFTFV